VPGDMIGIKEQLYKTPPMTDAVFVAHSWIAKGWRVAPCQPGTKQLLAGFGPYLESLDTAEKIEYWLRSRHANLAVIAPVDQAILDFDDPGLYDRFCEEVPEAACSYTERTPRGGAHVFVKVVNSVRVETVAGLEIKRIALVYPSLVAGKSYKVQGGKVVTVDLEETLKAFETIKQTPSPTCALPRLSHGQKRGTVATIAKIKDDWPIVEYLAFFEPGLRLTGSGRWLAGLCPFHQDRHPSLWIDSQRNLWGCHGCKAHGDVINWHALRKELTIADAIKDLVDWSGCVRVHV